MPPQEQGARVEFDADERRALSYGTLPPTGAARAMPPSRGDRQTLYIALIVALAFAALALLYRANRSPAPIPISPEYQREYISRHPVITPYINE